MEFKELTHQEKEAFFAKYILEYLQKYGGRAERSEIQERLLDEYEDIARFADEVRVSAKTGKPWSPFKYKFNFALIGLRCMGFVMYSRTEPTITLCEKGVNLDLSAFDPMKEVIDPAFNHPEHKKEQARDNEEESADSEKADDFDEIFKGQLLESIGKMSPKKFELFSRALLSKMGVEFTTTGTQISNDGGIDGYGYCRTDDFRTSRVVIQCKRWQGNVGSTEIDQFLGAMNKFQADYGIFITNSRYTQSAREAALAGTPITLIDGDELVRLVKKYQLYIIPVTTYILDDFYESE